MCVQVLLLLFTPTVFATESVNVALRGQATQIDTFNHLAAASNAIDGNRDSIYYHDSCTHTYTTTNPWWRVDLRDTHVITSITIVNRGDCCKQRLDGAEIRVGNSLVNNGNDNPMVVKINHIRKLKTFTMSERVVGRYVNVYLPGTDKYLTLCEVEVNGYNANENLARSGEAAQIGTHDSMGEASNAIDGNSVPNYSANSCIHTSTTTDPWWRVDLRATHTITSISIVNRRDCCQDSLNGTEIRVGNSLENNGNDNPVVATIQHVSTAQTFTIPEGVEGRYVNVFLKGQDKYLTFCEVEVYGQQVVHKNLALGGEASHIDTNDEVGSAANAIDGNRDPDYAHGSCSQTYTTVNPWWRVDLHKPTLISSVSITNRGDCCHEDIDGAQIRVGDSLENHGNDNPIVATIPRIPKGISQSFPLAEPVRGRYVNVFLPRTDKKLTLCEVEVYGTQEDVAPTSATHEDEHPIL